MASMLDLSDARSATLPAADVTVLLLIDASMVVPMVFPAPAPAPANATPPPSPPAPLTAPATVSAWIVGLASAVSETSPVATTAEPSIDARTTLPSSTLTATEAPTAGAVPPPFALTTDSATEPAAARIVESSLAASATPSPASIVLPPRTIASVLLFTTFTIRLPAPANDVPASSPVDIAPATPIASASTSVLVCASSTTAFMTLTLLPMISAATSLLMTFTTTAPPSAALPNVNPPPPASEASRVSSAARSSTDCSAPASVFISLITAPSPI